MIRPFFTGNNPLYKEEPYKSLWDRISPPLIEFLEGLKPNRENSDAFACDDMILWFRNLGFLDDPEFQKACEGFESSSFIRAKLYRVYTYCWAVRTAYQNSSSWHAVDLGTYDGKTVQIASRYCPEMTWWLFDMFDHHPAIENKGKHSAALYEEVKERNKSAHVFPGLLPATLEHVEPLPIAFIHVDLNDGATEVACLEKLYDRVEKGGIILLDDYGWLRYKDSQNRHDAFFKSKGKTVLEMPTGQGMVIV